MCMIIISAVSIYIKDPRTRNRRCPAEGAWRLHRGINIGRELLEGGSFLVISHHGVDGSRSLLVTKFYGHNEFSHPLFVFVLL